MEIFLLILFVFTGGLFGWLCADIITALEKKDDRKRWLGWVVMIVGLMNMMTGNCLIRYNCDHRQYDYDKYEIVNDTTITNHNGQIDTLATFKIVEK